MSRPDKPLYYPEYLKLDQLLDCQDPESTRYGVTAHDEMLFIIVHQAYELWFKQILWELDAVLNLFSKQPVAEKDVARAVAHLGRITEIQRVLIAQIDVLETMTPLDFLDFRDYLVPASGFQSLQFRRIENMLGMEPDRRLNIENTPYKVRFKKRDQERLVASEARTSLFNLLERWLERTPFLRLGDFDFWTAYRAAVDEMLSNEQRFIEDNPTLTPEKKQKEMKSLESTEAQFEALFDAEKYQALVEAGVFRLSHRAFQAALLINLFRDEPILHLPFRFLERLMDIDENFTKWRYRHALMVLRMIGTKVGTGGSSGHEYLRRTAEQHKVFGDLFSLSTFYIPRSALPNLPPEVQRAMDFRFNTPE